MRDADHPRVAVQTRLPAAMGFGARRGDSMQLRPRLLALAAVLALFTVPAIAFAASPCHHTTSCPTPHPLLRNVGQVCSAGGGHARRLLLPLLNAPSPLSGDMALRWAAAARDADTTLDENAGSAFD